MTKKQKNILLPPEKHKVRGLRIAEGSPNKPQLLKIVSAVKNDKSLDLQIRDGYLNVYYRGGSLLKISGFRGKCLSFKFADKYFKRKGDHRADDSWLPSGDEESCNTSLWISVFGKLKNTMNDWLNDNKNNLERDLQQQICSASTRNPESSWIILDVEYAAWLHDKEAGRRLCRFDMVAVERASLKSSKLLTIYLVEFKQGNEALDGSAGVESHARDLLQFISNDGESKAREALKSSVSNILKEKTEVGLLSGVDSFGLSDDVEIKALFLLHKSTISPEFQTSTEKILVGHGAIPLFWELSENTLDLVEYIQ